MSSSVAPVWLCCCSYPGQLIPLLLVLHLLLDLMDALQGLQALVQQEGGVVDQHVDVAHKLLARATGDRRGTAKQRMSINFIITTQCYHFNISLLVITCLEFTGIG